MIIKKLQSFDLFGEISQNISNKSYIGGLVSIISVSFIVFLLFSEFLIYKEFDIYQDIDIFHGKTDDKMLFNTQINLPKVSCYAIGIGLSDNKYTDKLQIDYYELVNDNKRNKVNPKKEMSEQFLLKQFENNVGCQINAKITVDQTEGLFQINLRNIVNQDKIEKLIDENKIEIDLSHYFDYLYFGNYEQILEIQNQFKNQESLNILKNHKENKQYVDYDYYLTIIPSNYVDQSQKEYFGYQYTSIAHNNINKNQIHKILIKYDFSPIQMTYHQTSHDLFDFIIQLLGIIGGILTTASIMDSIFNKSLNIILQKNRIGKLH